MLHVDDDSITNENQVEEVEEEDHIALTRHWQNERHAPELLPYVTNVVNNILELLENQVFD